MSLRWMRSRTCPAVAVRTRKLAELRHLPP
jgi:hypothetical protein